MASTMAEMPELAQWFIQSGVQRALFRKEIEGKMCSGPSENAGLGAPDGQLSEIQFEHGEAFAAQGDHLLLEETLRSEKRDLEEHDRILRAQGVPGRLAEVLNNQMTQIGLGLSRLEYLDALKYESE